MKSQHSFYEAWTFGLFMILLPSISFAATTCTFQEVPPPADRTDLAESCPFQFYQLLPENNYTLLEGNETVLIQNVILNVSFFLDGHPVVCAFVEDNCVVLVTGQFPKSLSIITLAIESTAALSSILLLLTYSLFKNMRTLSGKLIMNLAASFLAGDVSIIAIVVISVWFSEKITLPVWVYIVESYFFNTRFAWMSLIGYQIGRHIYNGMVFKFDDNAKHRKLLVAYLIAGWGAPLIPTSITIAVQQTLEEGDKVLKYLGPHGPVIVLVPIAITLVFNVGIIISILIMLCKASFHQSKLKSSKHRTTSFSRVFLMILTVLGLSWFFVFVVINVHSAQSFGINIAFICLTATQPIFVAIALLTTKKIFTMYITLCGCKRRTSPDTTTRSLRHTRTRTRRLASILFGDRDFSSSYRSSFKNGVHSNGTAAHANNGSIGTAAHANDGNNGTAAHATCICNSGNNSASNKTAADVCKESSADDADVSSTCPMEEEVVKITDIEERGSTGNILLLEITSLKETTV